MPLMDVAVDVGTTVRLWHSFATLDTVALPVDPATVRLNIKDPNGGERLGIVSRDSTGSYYSDVYLPMPGQWRYRWTSTDPQFANEGSLVVRTSAYADYSPPLFDQDDFALVVIQSETFERDLYYDDPSGAPVDLTGKTVRSQVRSYIGGPVTLELTTAITLPNEITLSLTHEQTRDLAESGIYDVWLIDPIANSWTRIMGGPFIVRPSVTSDDVLDGSSVIAGSNEWLIKIAESFAFDAWSNAVRDTNGALLSANITWPDGSAGAITTDAVSTTAPGFIDAWHITYVDTTRTRTLTQLRCTRDSNGYIAVQPPLIVS